MYNYEVKILKSLEVQNSMTNKVSLEIGDNIIIKMKDENLVRSGKIIDITHDKIIYKQNEIPSYKNYEMKLYYDQIEFIMKDLVNC